MSHETDNNNELFRMQVNRLGVGHFQILYWCTQCEGQGVKYNITNCFDDLKRAGITRTKQTAVALVETLSSLCYVDLKDDRNRKNITITTWGAKALRELVLSKKFDTKASSYLEELQS